MTTTTTTTDKARRTARATYDASIDHEREAWATVIDYGGVATCPTPVFDAWVAASKLRTAAFDVYHATR